jgi:hypothetical protein
LESYFCVLNSRIFDRGTLYINIRFDISIVPPKSDVFQNFLVAINGGNIIDQTQLAVTEISAILCPCPGGVAGRSSPSLLPIILEFILHLFSEIQLMIIDIMPCRRCFRILPMSESVFRKINKGKVAGDRALAFVADAGTPRARTSLPRYQFGSD